MNPPKNYLIDMDGVLITGGMMIPGADGFLARSEGARGQVSDSDEQLALHAGRPLAPAARDSGWM